MILLLFAQRQQTLLVELQAFLFQLINHPASSHRVTFISKSSTIKPCDNYYFQKVGIFKGLKVKGS